ncbi:hypothetical protein FB567DRAFT_319666 [Paraphoma chrysanthemicola]|uniref:Uncharacterized protein n=1 Tax=Paraphoma chrysanthemicola TaxID=798071 RepID=A0A8K0R857_9PLEO|nr:hypothetical protein FB567DRAFT_319666 [Paraphoma chrysanthemicola]
MGASSKEGAKSTVKDLQEFLATVHGRDNLILPQNPWAVSEGHYCRTDTSVVYLRGAADFQKTDSGAAPNDSTACLVEGDLVCERTGINHKET